MERVVTAERVFDGAGMHESSAVRIVDGRIVGIEPFSGHPEHFFVSPGLVDVQMNGFGDIDVAGADAESLSRLDALLLAEGTTHWLGTIVTAPLAVMAATVTNLTALMNSGVAAGMLGLHLEGPFLGGAPGAHRVRHIIAPDMEWIAGLPDSVRLVTLAPEQAGADVAVRSLLSSGVVVSLGHSRPTRDHYEAAVAAGATMVTHLFNGMSGIHHRDGGLALWALSDPRITMGLIGDGVHVAPDAMSLAFAVADGARTCLVSDSVAHLSPTSQRAGVTMRDGAPRLPDGTIAGSAASLSTCVRIAVHEAGIDPIVAMRSATSVPARLLGRSDVGRIKANSVASLVTWDEDLRVTGTFRGLQSVRARPSHA